MIDIVRGPIDVDRLERELRHPSDGAGVLFRGVVRDHAEGRRVVRLEYEAYEEMARETLASIRTRALDRYEVRDVAIVHRIGRVEIGEASVAVLVVASHRAPAFDACRFVIDALKAEAPIFKREFFEDGSRWVEGSG